MAKTKVQRVAILAVDVHYAADSACAAGVAFHRWDDADPSACYSSLVSGVQDYVPGRFFERELPCLLQLVREHSLSPGCIVIDGYVFLDAGGRPGLGKYLHDSLSGVPVIGVAKSPFDGIPTASALHRGGSTAPLYVTAAGMSLDAARQAIASMHGRFRMPTLLKMADRLSREHLSGSAAGP